MGGKVCLVEKFILHSSFKRLHSRVWCLHQLQKNIGTQGVQELFFVTLKPLPGGSSTLGGFLTVTIRVTHSRILVPDSIQCHYRVLYFCANFDDCCP